MKIAYTDDLFNWSGVRTEKNERSSLQNIDKVSSREKKVNGNLLRNAINRWRSDDENYFYNNH